MRLLERLPIPSAHGNCSVELYAGDVDSLEEIPAADYLVVTAYPDDDSPTDEKLDLALRRWGISLQELAQNKAYDMRHPFGCWISEELPISEGGWYLPFKRILCVESLSQTLPSDLIHDIFRCLQLFQKPGSEAPSLLMPISTETQPGLSVNSVMVPIAGAAAYWMGRGLPVQRLRLLVSESTVTDKLQRELLQAATKTKLLLDPHNISRYDLFISYAKINQKKAIVLYNELLHSKPDLKIFLGQRGRILGPGRQSNTFDALDHSKVVLSLLSPGYFRSTLCLRELHIAHHRQKLGEGTIWLPTIIDKGELPTAVDIPAELDFSQLDVKELRQACKDTLLPLVEGTRSFLD